jgi:hypothetical protein
MMIENEKFTDKKQSSNLDDLQLNHAIRSCFELRLVAAGTVARSVSERSSSKSNFPKKTNAPM